MMWLTWRQHRLQTLAGAGLLAVLAVAMIPTGLGLLAGFADAGLETCTLTDSACRQAADVFARRYEGLQFLIPLFLVVPVLVGVFWGAPLVAREFEQGTHRFVWMQGVTRRRWLVTKLAVLAGAGIVLSTGFSVLSSWWGRPLMEAADNRFARGPFDLQGMIVVGSTVLALAMGVAAGAAIRRTMPAMLVTIVGFTTVRLAIAAWVRPRYATAETLLYPLTGASPRAGRGDWILSTTTVDRAGRFIDDGISLNYTRLVEHCPDLPAPDAALPSPGLLRECIDRVGLQVQQIYQPGERFWSFQLIETALLLGFAGGLLWWTVCRVMHRGD